MWRVLASRNLDLALSLLAFILIAVALVMQHGFGLEPCPLCMMQRFVFLVLGIQFLLTFVMRTRAALFVNYCLAVLTSVIGLAFAGRHVWLQHLPKDQLPGCIPSLSYILDVFPLMEAVGRIFEGSADCGERSWTFLGFSIPEQTSITFIFYVVVTVTKVVHLILDTSKSHWLSARSKK